MLASLIAALLVWLGRVLGWRGVDMAAQVYRVDSFRAHGLTLWDFQWYGGNWTLGYSFLYPALAGTVGVAAVTIASAALATLSFDRLAGPHFGRAGRVASLVFAVGTVVPSAIGQLPFLTGEAFGLAAAWAASRGRWWLAASLGLISSLNSPLTGAFVLLGLAAWVVWRLRAGDRRSVWGPAALVGAAAGAPLLVAAVLFPGTGSMPYPVVDYLWEVAIAAVLWLAAGRDEQLVRAGAVLFVVAATVAVAVPSPLGGNVGRIEDVLALPLAVALLWRRWRWLLPLAAVPLALSQWTPAWGAITSAASQPSTQRSYFTPLVGALERFSAGGPAGRVEVVPTEFHWEAAYVAPVVPLARGWERQLDVGDNPIFYRTGSLDPASYRSWLLNNGVRFVALPDAPLDSAGQAEAKLVAAGSVPGLQLIWTSAHWRLYSVAGSTGIIATPARLVSESSGTLVVSTPRAGPVLIRVRYTPDWSLSAGAGCVTRSGPEWISVDTPRAEQFSLALSLLDPQHGQCGGYLAAPTAERVPEPGAQPAGPATG